MARFGTRILNRRVATGIQLAMIRLTFLPASLVTLLTMAPMSLLAQVGHWEYLGSAYADGHGDHDRIEVGATKGTFRRIQIVVDNSAVDLDRIVVNYPSGQKFPPIRLASHIPAGGKTAEIDLPGGSNAIKSVEFWYQKGPWEHEGRPKIILMGLH